MRYAALLLALSLVFSAVGCGGSDPDTQLVVIRGLEFFPDDRTISPGASVTWSNADNQTHSVVSGVLVPTTTPKLINVGILNTRFTLNGGMADRIDVTLGDTIQFTNFTSIQRQIEIKEQDLDVVFLSPVLSLNETASYTTTVPGNLVLKDSIGSIPDIPLRVEGVPLPDGLFRSGTLAPGDQFEFAFPSTGTFPYFDGFDNTTNGVIIVQP